MGESIIRNVPYSVVLQKYWFSLLLLSLTAVSFVSIHLALFTAVIFTFLVPGLTFSRLFNLKPHETWAFVPIFSVLISTQLVYYLSLLLGYSRETILFSFIALTGIYTLVNLRKRGVRPLTDTLKIKQVNKTSMLVLSLIFVLSLVVLYKSVWFENEYGIVITGSNWQDTPMHYEIIENLNNGNFPPEMPYYSGKSMTYYYFVDCHTAILEKVYGFLPELLPVLNAIFILIFALSVYSLARENGRRAATIATVVATFGWGFSYVGLFSALTNGQFNVSHNYMYQYDGFFGLPPIFDNLLQQRPLLMGLPAFALVLALLKNMEDENRILLAGVITGLLFPFHSISFFCCYVAYFVSVLLNIKRFRISYLYFLVPSVAALPFVLSAEAAASISFGGAWAYTFIKENPIYYYVLNLGIPFLISLISLVELGHKLLKGAFVILFLIPNFILLTPNTWDMYKLLIFSWVPIAVLTGIALARTRKSIALVLILLSILASASVVIYNLGTNYPAASWDEYNLGVWVRENTPQKSVFLTYYSIHSPPTMIGGRERVLSYVNWPYGHGLPLDDIWKRAHDIDRAYNGSENDLKEVVDAYRVGYVYVGGEELRRYPGCVEKFEEIGWLKPVYNVANLRIYQVYLSQN